MTAQPDLFGGTALPPLPPGLVYEPDFIGAADEAALVDAITALPLAAAKYQQYTARRRVVAWGGAADADNPGQPAGTPLPAPLAALRGRVAGWMGLSEHELVHLLVTEYAPGTSLGWHRDAPHYERIAGVSLGAEAVLRWRPMPHLAPDGLSRADTLKLAVQPRSAYRMEGPARWGWQHSVAPTKALRWSVTFRTARR